MGTDRTGGVGRINSFFNHEGLRRFWLRIRFLVGVAALCLLIPFVQREWFWIGLAVSLLGEAIQLWCFASLKKTKVLACLGPYALVRNPMYLGRYFIVLGVVLLLGLPGVWAIAPYTVFYGFYMYNRVRREERKLAEVFGADYEAYCRRVNRFLPSFGGGELRCVPYWNWGLLTGNHGWLNAAALLAAYAVLYYFVFCR